MKVDFHINFSGECQAAFEYYQSVLGGEIKLLRYGDSPAAAEVPPQWQEKIVHGSLKLHHFEIAGADVLPELYKTPQGFHLLLQLDNENEAARIFSALSKGGSVTMPLQRTFWSPCYGILIDPFGLSWEINCA